MTRIGAENPGLVAHPPPIRPAPAAGLFPLAFDDPEDEQQHERTAAGISFPTPLLHCSIDYGRLPINPGLGSLVRRGRIGQCRLSRSGRPPPHCLKISTRSGETPPPGTWPNRVIPGPTPSNTTCPPATP